MCLGGLSVKLDNQLGGGATGSLYVHYGCGVTAPTSWKNYDASPRLRFRKVANLRPLFKNGKVTFPDHVGYGDIVKGLPIEPGCCAGIYASHVLEHLSLQDFRTALRNTHDLLKPRGIFRLVVPDLTVYAGQYIASTGPAAAEQFMRSTGLGAVSRPRGVVSFVRSWLGNSAHLWMWDYPSLERELLSTGFVDVRRCHFGDSGDPMFDEVENKERFRNSVAVECRRA